jgi:transcriptional regulator with XRE-family HTH domain
MVSSVVRRRADTDYMPSKRWTNTPFVDEVPRLLIERGLSIRALARQVEISDPHLSRVLRRADYKTVSGDLARRVALALDLPADYFPEYRAAVAVERIRNDPVFRDRVYAQARRG